MRVDLLPEDTNASSQIASFRLDLDSASSPGPNGSLLVTPGQYNTYNEFDIPLTQNFVGAGLCTSYVIGENTEFDLSNVSTGIVKLLRGGHFNLSFTCYIVDSVNEADGTIVMILLNGQTIFASPPATACSRTQGDVYSTVLPGLLIKSLTGACNIVAEPNDEIVMRVLLNNVTPGNDCMIQACTNLSCTKIDYNLYGLAGPQGIPGNDGIIQSVDNVDNAPPAGYTSLVQNPGANANIFLKNLKQGSNITITDNGSDLEIASIGGTPNSDFANLGAGNAVLSTTGILPVTTTRNFKTLVAGTNITISPTINSLTFSSTSNNIYNTNGSLTANRTLTLNGFFLNITGNGNIQLTPTAGTTTLGLSGWTTELRGIINMPHLSNATNTNIMMYNTASKNCSYEAISTVFPSSAIFSVTTSSNTFSIAGPYSAKYDFPVDVALSYVSTLGNFTGYNNAGLDLNLGTGVYSPSQTNNYNISCKLTLKNDTEIPNIELQVYDGTLPAVVLNSKYNNGVINSFNTYLMNSNIVLTALHNYTFRLIINNGAGSTTDFENCIFSINKVSYV